jgi:SAM-dependent methyltransferase
MADKFATDETARNRAEWAQRGEAWDRRADELADMAGIFNQPLIDALAFVPGQSVIDCATGAGEPALTVAGLIAPGTLLATDLVSEMLAGARRRAGEAGIGNIAFQVADMAALPFPDNYFDRLICRFGLMFVPRPEQATAQALRVLKPGGRAGYMVWGPRSGNTAFDALARACVQVFGADDPLVDFTTPFKLAEAGAAASALEVGGFENVRETDIRFRPQIPATERFWEIQLDMGLGRRWQTATAKQRLEVEDLIKANLETHIKNGKYQLELHVKIAIGEKPV